MIYIRKWSWYTAGNDLDIQQEMVGNPLFCWPLSLHISYNPCSAPEISSNTLYLMWFTMWTTNVNCHQCVVTVHSYSCPWSDPSGVTVACKMEFRRDWMKVFSVSCICPLSGFLTLSLYLLNFTSISFLLHFYIYSQKTCSTLKIPVLLKIGTEPYIFWSEVEWFDNLATNS